MTMDMKGLEQSCSFLINDISPGL